MPTESSPLALVREVFGLEQFPDAMFYALDHALRFELGGDLPMREQPTSRFLRAIDRARAVSAVLFERSTFVDVLVRHYEGDGCNRDRRRTQVALARAGFRLPLGPIEALVDTTRGMEGHPMACWRRVRMAPDPELIAPFLWCAVAAEMPITPKAGFGIMDCYITDFEAGAVLHVYDDRGMDVAATSRETLQPLYDRFGDWLLDYDRLRMDADFGT